MAMDTVLFKIKVITNLHAGSGDAEYGIVDKLVQRDAATRMPTIYGSSIKGALKEYCRNQGQTWLTEIFGNEEEIMAEPINENKSESNEEVKEESKTKKKRITIAGKVRFLAADLMALPVPHNSSPYFRLAWDDGHLEKLLEKYQHFNTDISFADLIPEREEGGNANEIISEKYKSEFQEALDELPVIARNHLENGISQNLWYEEVVPHQSQFIFGVQADGSFEAGNFKEFITAVNDKIIQVGGNATVGYGLCKFTQIFP